MDKLLAKKTFSYPIYRADTEYRYRKIGTPTVFAELLMSLAHNDFPQLADNNLAQIAHVLKLDFTFIRYTLENLNDTGLIEHIDLPDKKDDLDKLSLIDLRLTDNGKKFYREKKMPGRRRTEDAEFWFNPLLNEYVGKPKQSANNVEYVELNCSLFPVDEALLQQLSGQESTNQKWFDAETELEHDGISVTCDEDTFLPQTVPVKLTLDGNRYLNIDSSDKLFSQWINTRDPQVIKEHLLKPMISNAKNALQGEAFLYYPENDLLSLVLADQESDIRQIGDAVEVKFNGNQEIDDKMPLIVFADIAEAKLDGKHLSIPALLKDSDGLTRALQDSGISDIAQRITLHFGDACALMPELALQAGRPDVVYLDPMYPERRKSAKVKKHMQALQQLIGHGADDAALLARARLAATRRVIVKRPQHAPPLADITPDYTIDGPNTRYDIYLAP